MRISDGSSDVCSSDLVAPERRAVPLRVAQVEPQQRDADLHPRDAPVAGIEHQRARAARHRADRLRITGVRKLEHHPRVHRSEEHTSELQSLMRISYAVFCLKKKNTPQQTKNHSLHIQLP